MKKKIEDLQSQKATPNLSVATESLKEELRYLRIENLTKTQIDIFRKSLCSIYFVNTKLIKY